MKIKFNIYLFCANAIFAQPTMDDLHSAIKKFDLNTVKSIIETDGLTFSADQKQELLNKSTEIFASAAALIKEEIKIDPRLVYVTIPASILLSFGSWVAFVQPRKWYKQLWSDGIDEKSSFKPVALNLAYISAVASAVSLGVFKASELLQKNKRKRNFESAQEIKRILESSI